MELHQLRYVLAVAEQGSFSRAAERLFVVQSTVSSQVRKLEHELGVALFDRRSGAVVLTAFGQAFLPHVRDVLSALEGARTSLASVRGLTSGRASFGVLGTVVGWLLPEVTRRFLQLSPGVELWLTEEPSGILGGMVASRDLPQALLHLPQHRQDVLEYTPLFSEELVLVVPADHACCGAGTVTLASLAEEDLLLPELGNDLRELISQACSAVGFEARSRVEVGKGQLAYELAVAGVAPAFVPALTAVHDLDGAPERVVRVVEPRLVRPVGLARYRGAVLSPADAALSDIIGAVVQEALSPGGLAARGRADRDPPLAWLGRAPV